MSASALNRLSAQSRELEVTLVAHDIGPVGGMERQMTELIGGLLGHGYVVTVVSRTCSVPTHPNLHWVRVRGPARPFPIAYPWFFVLGSLQLKRRARGIVHSTGAIVFNRTACTTVHLCHRELAQMGGLQRVARASLAYRLNGRVAARLSGLAERWCYRRRRTDRLVAVSSGVAAELNRHFPKMADRIVTVSNGVDTAEFRPAPAEGPSDTEGDSEGMLTALFVGSEWEGKGLRYAIEALVGLANWRLVVVGRGDVERYGALAESRGLAGRVIFHGVSENVAPLYRAADAFVLPTGYESFSLVTYEAAASGLPLLATKVSGIEDLLEPGINGWFVKRAPADIRQRLAALGRDPDLRRRMGDSAREASLAFSWEAMVDGYERLYYDRSSHTDGHDRFSRARSAPAPHR